MRAWANRPTFYYELGGLGGVCGGFYIYNLEPVAVSGRRRFNIVSPAREASMGTQMYAQTMNEFNGAILPEYSSEHRMVSRVLERLIPHSGLSSEENNWEIHVIDDPTPNAFVIPGGKVFVFKGILPIAGTEDGLAAVLGHEIAHNVAHHAAERMSRSAIILPFAIVGSLLVGLDVGIGNWIAKLAFELPGSRKEESEADYIGLLMMAEACFDPKAAIGLWQRMEAMESKQGSGGAPPAFLSTHPSSHDRGEKIRGWLNKAEEVYQRGDCGSVGRFGE
jgi:predicted Zn-dependent protease